MFEAVPGSNILIAVHVNRPLAAVAARMVFKKGHKTNEQGRNRSPSTTPVPSTEAQNDGSHLPEAQWDGMHTVLNAIYDYRTEE